MKRFFGHQNKERKMNNRWKHLNLQRGIGLDVFPLLLRYRVKTAFLINISWITFAYIARSSLDKYHSLSSSHLFHESPVSKQSPAPFTSLSISKPLITASSPFSTASSPFSTASSPFIESPPFITASSSFALNRCHHQLSPHYVPYHSHSSPRYYRHHRHSPVFCRSDSRDQSQRSFYHLLSGSDHINVINQIKHRVVFTNVFIITLDLNVPTRSSTYYFSCSQRRAAMVQNKMLTTDDSSL